MQKKRKETHTKKICMREKTIEEEYKDNQMNEKRDSGRE